MPLKGLQHFIEDADRRSHFLSVAVWFAWFNALLFGVFSAVGGAMIGLGFLALKNGFFIGAVVALCTLSLYCGIWGIHKINGWYTPPAIGALVADVFAFIFAFYSHVLIDPWTFSTFLAQLIIAVVCGSVIGGGVSYGFLDKEISMPKLE